MYVSVFFFRRWFVTLYFKNPINNIKTEFTTFRVTKELVLIGCPFLEVKKK
jgi:hypothetical protein